jgi:hypothetical protein
MAVNIKSGVVLAVGQPQQIASQRSGKTFTKRTLYLDCTPYDGITGERSQYENKLLFEFMESKTSLLDNIKPGQVVTVSFDLQGSEITDQTGQTKHFIHVRPFGIEVRQTQQPQAPQQQYASQPIPQYQPQPQAQQFPSQQADSDMPF